MISNSTSPIISFKFADLEHSFGRRKILKQVIARIFVDYKKNVESVVYIFCSDAYLLDINTRFLQHTDLTDIITFNLAPTSIAPIEGEIYISLDRVSENAKIFGVDFQGELCRVLFHGALHLCGLKDKKATDIKLMRSQEDHYIKLYASLAAK